MSSSSRIWDATPLASAAAGALARVFGKTVHSVDCPKPEMTARAIRAGASNAPASAEPSQSRMERSVSITTCSGRSLKRVCAMTSASCRLTIDGRFQRDRTIGAQRPRVLFRAGERDGVAAEERGNRAILERSKLRSLLPSGIEQHQRGQRCVYEQATIPLLLGGIAVVVMDAMPVHGQC